MTEPRPTQAGDLIRAAEIGAEEGLRFVYAGNLAGGVGDWENTRCPVCRETLIARHGYLIESYQITRAGTCPRCGAWIPGVWPADGAAEVPAGGGMAASLHHLPRPLNLN